MKDTLSVGFCFFLLLSKTKGNLKENSILTSYINQKFISYTITIQCSVNYKIFMLFLESNEHTYSATP